MSRPAEQQHSPHQESATKKQKLDSDGRSGGEGNTSASAPLCLLSRLPAALLLHTAQQFLLKRDVRSLVCAATYFHSPLQHYRIHEEMYLEAALPLVGGSTRSARTAPAASAAARANGNAQARWRFGIPARVYVPSHREWPTWSANIARLQCVRHLRLYGEDGALQADSLPPQLHTIEFDSTQYSRYGQPWQLKAARWPSTLTALLNVDSPAQWQWPLPDGLRVLTFGWHFNQPLDGLHLSDTITELRFGSEFNQSLSTVRLPAQLRILRCGDEGFSSSFAHPLPAQLATLANLTQLHIYSSQFNQPVADIAFPPALLSFILRCAPYSHPLHLGHLPATCASVSLLVQLQADGEFDWAQLQLPSTVRSLTVSADEGRVVKSSFSNWHLPAELTELRLHVNTDASLSSIKWPSQLRSLTLGKRYSGVISDECLPSSLTSLIVEDCIVDATVLLPQEQLQLAGLTQLATLYLGRYDGPIDEQSLPPSLTEVTLGVTWDGPMDELHLPAGLRKLRFGWYFNQPLDGFTFPPSLTSLSFSEQFNQPLAGVELPPSLTHLSLGDGFVEPLDDVHFPLSLRCLLLGRDYSHPLRFVAALHSLTRLELRDRYLCVSSLPAVWPAALRIVVVHPDVARSVAACLPPHVAIAALTV